MYLLVVILLTAGGMSEPQVYRMATEAACLTNLLKAEQVAQQFNTHGYVVACVRTSGAGV